MKEELDGAFCTWMWLQCYSDIESELIGVVEQRERDRLREKTKNPKIEEGISFWVDTTF
jgi:hypothetical protein